MKRNTKRLRRIMKAVLLTRAHRRHSVAHRGPVMAAGATDGAVTGREDEERAPLQVDPVRARLRSRALLEQDELAA